MGFWTLGQCVGPGRCQVEPRQRQAYLGSGNPITESAWAAPGCTTFYLATDPLELDRINVVEQWPTTYGVQGPARRSRHRAPDRHGGRIRGPAPDRLHHATDLIPKGADMSAEEIDQYLANLDESKRSTLESLRATILRLVPEAEQGLSYGVPAFRVDGKVIAGFSAANAHLSYLPHSGAILAELEPAALEGFQATKGALRFPVDTPPPDALVAKLIAARFAEINR